MRVVMASLLVLATGLSACLAPEPKPDCQGPECAVEHQPGGPQMVERPPGSPFPRLPLNESLRSVRLENCTGLGASVQLAAPLHQDDIPPAFRWEGWPPGTGRLQLEGLVCERAVVPGKIVNGYKHLKLSATVRTRNTSWENSTGPSFWLLDYLTDSEAVKDALVGFGIPAEIGVFSISRPLGGLSASALWTVTRNETQFQFEYHSAKEPGQLLSQVTGLGFGGHGDYVNHLWVGTDPFLRSTLDSSFGEEWPAAAGTLRLHGPSRTASLLGEPAAPWIGNYKPSFEESWVVNPDLYSQGD